VFRRCYWHPSFGTCCTTSSGFMLQPNIQEREFGCYAPSLDSFDPALVRMFYLDCCQVAHACGVYMPACEEFRPEDTFSTIECGDTPTARVPKFCQSQVPQWEAIMHHHLKCDNVIPSSHPQANEIKHNPNGYEALMLLMYPCHPAFTDNGILIQPHPQQVDARWMNTFVVASSIIMNSTATSAPLIIGWMRFTSFVSWICVSKLMSFTLSTIKRSMSRLASTSSNASALLLR